MKKILKRIGIVLGGISIILLLMGLFIVQKGFIKYDFTPYSVSAHTDKTWQEVFSHPTEIEVIRFSTGSQLTDRYPENPTGAVDRYKPTEMTVFLIRHPHYGDILIDAGLDESFTSNHFGNYPIGIKLVLTFGNKPPITQESGQDIASQLMHYDADLKYVFFTHLHPDHMAGIPVLPKNIPYVFEKDELYFQSKALLVDYYFQDRPNVQVLDIKKRAGIPPFEYCADLLGDGSLWAISTPGHTPGHLSFVVNSVSGPVLITGDAALYDWGLEKNIGGAGFHDDIDLLLSSTRPKLLEFINAYPTMKVFVGHEINE